MLQLNEGSGSILVVAVGVNTEYGKTMSLVMTEAASTPLQEHLEVLAASIGKVGVVVAVICFIVLLIRCAGLWDVSAAVALPMLSIANAEHWSWVHVIDCHPQLLLTLQTTNI